MKIGKTSCTPLIDDYSKPWIINATLKLWGYEMKFGKTIVAIGFLAAFGMQAQLSSAQSVITLDDFDLEVEPSPSEPAAKSQLESCLLGSADCKSDELKSGASFSLDDVLNLGVIDRSQVKAEPASTSTNTDNNAASVAASADPLPSVDMEILFDYNSANIRWDQKERLIDLARTLSSSDFRKFSVLFVGHTDAKGSAEYNKKLSSQRAEAVADFIRVNTAIPSTQIVSSGVGFDRLKDRNDPFSERNRRVQLVLIPLKN